MPTTKKTTILAIETSCDETSIAIVRCAGGLKNPSYEILSNTISSQVALHAPFGGVVPNIAKREHIKNLPIILTEALREAEIENPGKEINALAVTAGPGLEPALWTGITFAGELSQNWKLPLVAANHMEGHLAAILLPTKSVKSKVMSGKKTQHSTLNTVHFPAIALLVSGGHTEIVLVKKWSDYTLVGQTRDDAAGEAFDKVARMMSLPYPGGPQISKLAATGNRYAFSFPRPMMHTKNFDFSFSGLKTAVLYTLRDLEKEKITYTKNDIAASFEDAAVDVLVSKTIRAAGEYGARTVFIGGGVAANQHLRERLVAAGTAEKNMNVLLPAPELTTDNAAMIAAAAYFHAENADFANWKKLEARAMMPL